MKSRGIASVLACAACAGGCTYGVRGGVGTTVYSSGPVMTEAVASGYAGFGSTARYGAHSGGIQGTLSLGVGHEASRGGFSFAALGGIEYFRLSEAPDRRWGWRLGFEAGARTHGGRASRTDLLVQARGGPLLRLGTRDRHDQPLVMLGLDLTLGMHADLTNDPPEDSGLVVGLALTAGFSDIRPFHL